jgi:hypothetical protein
MNKGAIVFLAFSVLLLSCKEQEKLAPKSGIPWEKLDGRIVVFSAEIVSVIDGGAKRIDTILRKPKLVPYQIYGSHGVSLLGDRLVYTVYKSNSVNLSASIWSMKPDGSENSPALSPPVYTTVSPSINKDGHIAYTANFGWLKPMSLWVDENKICSFNDFLGGILRNHLSWHPNEEKLLMSLANYSKGNLTASLYELNTIDTIPKLLVDAPLDTRYYLHPIRLMGAKLPLILNRMASEDKKIISVLLMLTVHSLKKLSQ